MPGLQGKKASKCFLGFVALHQKRGGLCKLKGPRRGPLQGCKRLIGVWSPALPVLGVLRGFGTVGVQRFKT